MQNKSLAIATATARIQELEAELAAARADLAALEAENNGPSESQQRAVDSLVAFVEANLFQTWNGPTGHYTGAVKGLITKRYKKALATWDGQFDAFWSYVNSEVNPTEEGAKAAVKYLTRTYYFNR